MLLVSIRVPKWGKLDTDIQETSRLIGNKLQSLGTTEKQLMEVQAEIEQLTEKRYERYLQDDRRFAQTGVVPRIPQGFRMPEDFTADRPVLSEIAAKPKAEATARVHQCVTELRTALDAEGIQYRSIEIRGSSATDISSKGGGFRYESTSRLSKSDIDLAVVLDSTYQLPDGLTASTQQPGLIHPDKVTARFGTLKAWADRWTAELGREITPALWTNPLPDHGKTVVLFP